MNRYKPAFYVTSVLLALSVGGHLWARRDDRAEGPAAGVSASPVGRAGVPDEAAQVDDKLRAAQRELLRLRAELARCQEQSWDMAGELMQGRPSLGDDAEGGDGAGSLCAMSQAVVRKQWTANEPKARELLGKELGTESWVERDLKWRLDRHRNQLDLAARDEAALERGYRGIWHRHGERMRQQAAEGDWEAAAETVRAFWREEDELVGEVLRPEELASFKEREVAVRKPLLAMLAAYGDQPWNEESLTW